MSGFVEFCRARVVRKIYVFEKIKKKIFTFCIGIFMKKIGIRPCTAGPWQSTVYREQSTVDAKIYSPSSWKKEYPE